MFCLLCNALTFGPDRLKRVLKWQISLVYRPTVQCITHLQEVFGRCFDLLLLELQWKPAVYCIKQTTSCCHFVFNCSYCSLYFYFYFYSSCIYLLLLFNYLFLLPYLTEGNLFLSLCCCNIVGLFSNLCFFLCEIPDHFTCLGFEQLYCINENIWEVKRQNLSLVQLFNNSQVKKVN